MPANQRQSKTNGVVLRKRWVVLAAAACLAPWAAAAPSVIILNPSFESNGNFNTAPGYITGNAAITGWTSSNDARIGVNNVGQPFASGTTIPDATHVAFIQNSGGTGTLSQTISGLDTTKQYWFQVFANTRQDGGTSTLNATYGGQQLVTQTFAGGTAAYTFINVPFTPATASAALTFANTNTTRDNTLDIDAVSVIQRDANQVVLANPSFEGSQGTGGAGYATAVAGWKVTGNVAINRLTDGSAPFGVGTPPDGNEVAILQTNPGAASLSQVLPALVPGTTYTLTFNLNARATYDTPSLSVQLGDHALVSSQTVTPGAAYQLASYTFVANAADAAGATLTFTGNVLAGGPGASDGALFIDNVSLGTAVPEPASVGLAALGGLALLARRRRA